MQPLNDRLASSFIEHDIGIQRLEADQRNKILRELKALEQQLIVKVQQVAGVETFTAARQRALLAQVQRQIAKSYGTILKTQREDMKQLALYETRSIPKLINEEAGANVMAVGAPAQVVQALINDDTIIGAPLKTIWEQEAGTLRQAFIAQMRQGIMAGETTDDLVRRIRGTAARGYKDGIMNPREKNVEMRVRTSAQSVLNDARYKMYEANIDVLEGMQWQSTLDDRTSEICMALSGQAWDFGGNPIGDTDQQFPGPPPAHPNCRSTLIPLVKGIGDILAQPGLDEEIKEEVAKLPQATQASMDGQVAGDLTYEQWLETKSEDFQKEVLGEGKYALWEADKIGLKDLIDQRANPLTIAELEAKYGKPTTRPTTEPPEPTPTPEPTEPTAPTAPEAVQFGDILLEKSFADFTPAELAAIRRQYPKAKDADLQIIWERVWQQRGVVPKATVASTGPTVIPPIPDINFLEARATDYLKAYQKPNKYGAFLTPLTRSELTGAEIYMNFEKNVGYKLDTLKDLGGLFNNGGPKRAGAAAINDAIQNGALTLDAFDDYLPKLYAQHGFVPVARMKFNPDFAPPGWNYDKFKQPDVVFMAYNGGPRANIAQRVGQFAEYNPSAPLPYFTDYDLAKSEARRAALAFESRLQRGGGVGAGAVGGTEGVGGVRAGLLSTAERRKQLSRPVDRAEEIESESSSQGMEKWYFEGGGKAIFKPASGEYENARPGIPNNEAYLRDGLYTDVAEMVGNDDIVATSIVKEVDGEIGSVQEWLDNAKVGNKAKRQDYLYPDEVKRGAVMDYIMGQQDRHGDNWMVTSDGHFRMIDNALSMPQDKEAHYRIHTIETILGNKTQPIPPEFVNIYRDPELWKRIVAKMKESGVGESAVKLAIGRRNKLLKGMKWGDLHNWEWYWEPE